jgi:hypothetical protein
MRRRALLQHGVLAAGAVMAAPVFASLDELATPGRGSALLAMLDDSGLNPKWRLWSECSSACQTAGMHGIRIDSIAFPESLQRASVDALFSTVDGPRPYRIASLQRDSLSPISKPFAFAADAGGLLGFQVEQQISATHRTSVMAAALLDRQRQRLVAGRYLLAITADKGSAELSKIVRALPAAQVFSARLGIACIEFSVLSPAIG